MAVIDGEWLSKEGLTYFWSKIKSIFTKQTETNAIANRGSKNLLMITNNIVGSKTTTHGRTFEILSDGGIKITGSPDTSYADFYLIGTWSNRTTLMDLSDQKYLISLASSSSSSIEKLYVRALDRRTGSTASSATARAVPNQQTEFSFPVTTILITIEPSATIPEDGIIVYPMIRPAAITDASFQPYAPTNRELYETRLASKFILPNNVDLNNIKTGGIYNGITSTGNSAVHMPVATGSFNFVLTVIEANEFVIQIFKQLNSAGDPNFYVRRFYIYNSDWDSWYQFTGTQV